MKIATYHFTFILPDDVPRETAELVEDAEDSRAFPLEHIESECRRLAVGAKLYRAGDAAYCGHVEDDGNVVFG
jgi:hypothetical protein